MSKQDNGAQGEQPAMPKPARGGQNVGSGSHGQGREGNGAQKLQQKKK